MTNSSINAWTDGDEVEARVAVKRKRLQPFRSKPGQYLSLTLSDSTGQIEAVVWEEGEVVAESFEEGDIVAICGKVGQYRDQPQLVISSVRRVAPEEVAAEEFLPACRRDIEPLEQALRATIESVEDPYLRGLLDAFYGDPEFMDRFRRAPAAMRLHHAYVGGLLEHTVEVVSLLEVLSEHYPDINRELVITGALLHDIGKLKELTATTMFDYTDAGRLLGHVAISDRLVCEAMDSIDGFPDDTRMMVRHLVLSHHGSRELGSPEPPKTLEAMALHQAENADAQVNRVWQTITKHRDGKTKWTDWDRLLERHFYLGPVQPPEPETSR